ncbi:MAG TPA: creatininase family protein [Acidimicrobiia bacterium]|nr:creatininase family protein [Acidimicrobiia bacterium]
MNELALMTTIEAEQALSKARLAVVPVGSLEQHGPHLPLMTDSAVAEAFARRVVDELGDDAVLLPLIGYGLSEHHLGFAGTITLRPNTMLELLADIFESLRHHGLRRVLVVNGHGGNIDLIRLAARNARRDHRMMVASVMWAVVAADIARERASSPAYGHACEIETSVMMALLPDEVRRDRIVAGGRHTHDELTEPPGGSVDEPVWLHEWSDDGAIGRPDLANEDDGAEIVGQVVERVVGYARRMIQREPEGRSRDE